ncbi:MAG: hypothetical protein QQN63_08560, partial [Nitrosopumilus sp.]
MSPTSSPESREQAVNTRKDTAIRTAINFRLLFIRKKEEHSKLSDTKLIKAVQNIFYDQDEMSGHPKYISNTQTKRTLSKQYSPQTVKIWLQGKMKTTDGIVPLGPNLLTPIKNNNVFPIAVGIQEVTRLHNEVQIVKQRVESLIQLLM